VDWKAVTRQGPAADQQGLDQTSDGDLISSWKKRRRACEGAVAF